MSILSNVKTYAKLVWENLPSKRTPVDAKNLNRMEEGIAWNNEAIKEIADAVMSEIVNDPNKIASLAAVYYVKQDVVKVTNDLENKITNPVSAAVGQVLAVKSIDANGKPTEYETVKNEASPADWSVNDENVPGYIANRTHWEELIQEQGTLLEETTIEFTTNLASISGIGTSNVKDGGEYIVYWNGNVYECTAFTDSQSIILGNGALVSTGEDTGEPFGMEMLAGTSALIMKSTKDVETVTLKIEAKEVVVCHKIDKKYLPDDIKGGSGGVTSWNDLTDKPFYEDFVEILPTTSFEFIEDSGMYIGILPSLTSIRSGTVCRITYNEKVYECVAHVMETDVLTIGNSSIFGGGVEEDVPFGIMLLPTETYLFSTDNTVSAASIKIEALLSIPIDERYVPKIGTIDLVSLGLPTVTDTSYSTVTLTREQLAEMYDTLKNGIVRLKLKLTGDIYIPDALIKTNVYRCNGAEIELFATVSRVLSDCFGVMTCELHAHFHGAIIFITLETNTNAIYHQMNMY